MKGLDGSVKRILVVEDEPAIANLCREVLAGEKLGVDIAANGRTAQDMLEWRQYDLCLVDLSTPGMSGQELYQLLKEKHPQLANHVIFTTGAVINGDIQSFLEQTGGLFLPKPFTIDELKAIVREALSQMES